MEWTNGSQMQLLFLSCGLGFLFGAYYDIFRVWRLVMRCSARTVFIQDLLFFASASLGTFLFALAVTGGEMRVYLFLGLAVGFSAYYFTIGRVVIRCAGAVCAAVLKAWRWFWNMVFYPFRLFFRLLRRPASWLSRFAGNMAKKFREFLKKRLKHTRTLLYNQKEQRKVAHRAKKAARSPGAPSVQQETRIGIPPVRRLK